MIFNTLKNLFKRKDVSHPAYKLYISAVQAARTPTFFLDYGVPDSVDGRFDLVSLHVFILQRRFHSINTPEARRLSQDLAEVMWSDMDDSIRELGVGDLSVPKHLKGMIGAYQGRVISYTNSLAESEEAFAQALWRNVYRQQEGQQGNAAKLAQHMANVLSDLMQTDETLLMSGDVSLHSAT